MYWITGLCFRNLSSNTVRQLHTLPKLPYDYNALEPIISKEIMELHHGKHHATYVKNLNAAEEKLKVAIDRNDTASIVALQNAISFNGGGHLNHSIYWKNLSPNGGEPSSVLKNAISKTFGTFDKFRKELSEQSIAIQGSGWGWLGFCPKTKQLKITTSQNQDSLLTSTGVIPLLTIDVWEHAYYLQYKNVRADYVNQIFDIVNWEDVSSRYEDAIGIGC